MGLFRWLFRSSKSSNLSNKELLGPPFLADFLIAQVLLNIRFNISDENFHEFSVDVPNEIQELITSLWRVNLGEKRAAI